MHSRRNFTKLALAAPLFTAARAATIDSTVHGVRLGTITYSFRDLPRTPGRDNLDAIIEALQFCRIGEIELYSLNMEPAGQPLPPEPPTPYGMPRRARPPRTEEQNALNRRNREALRQWRIETPAAHYQEIRAKFDAAGIRIFALTIGFNDSFTDEEIDACFRQAKALGVETIASSTSPAMAPRLAPFAARHEMKVAVHGYSALNDPNRFASPESFAKALALSPWFRINLDIGHFAAANLDPVAFIREHHEQITHLHVKDRKRNDGTNESFGDGDTPIKPVLALLKENRYPIPAFIEYEYTGLRSSREEVRRCMEYMRSALD
jgi:sugar phosphate isomerase/epimerase